MSIEHWVYSPDPVLDRASVAQACGKLEENGWAVTYVRDLRAPVAEDDGPLSSGWVLGWIPGGPAEAEIRRAIRAGDAAAIDDLYARGLLAIVGLRVAERGRADWANVEIDLRSAETPARFRAEVEQTATFYAVETDARRTEIALEFQILFWRAVGVLSNGLMEDPQENELISTIEEIGRDGKRADREAAAVAEAAAQSRSQPERGALALHAAVVLVLGVELLSGFLFAPITGVASLVRRLVAAGAVVYTWHGARSGDSFSYWLLVALPAALFVLHLWYLPSAAGGRAGWLVARALVHLIATVLLLLPSTRRFATRNPEA